MPENSIALTDPRALRAYAHPVRMQLVGLLRREGPLTASQAGRLLGESSGTTSFHLRQLARYGLVEPAGGGRGREKPWRATAMFTHLPDVTTPDTAEATTAVFSAVARRYFEGMLDWVQRAPSEPAEWQRAAPFSDYMLYLTVDELAQLVAQVDQLLMHYAGRVADRAARPAGARLVTYLNIGLPAGRP